jgi:hypothetical protein
MSSGSRWRMESKSSSGHPMRRTSTASATTGPYRHVRLRPTSSGPSTRRACRYRCHRTARNIITHPWRGFSATTPCTFNGCSARWLNAAALDNGYITVRPLVIQQLLSQRMRCSAAGRTERRGEPTVRDRRWHAATPSVAPSSSAGAKPYPVRNRFVGRQSGQLSTEIRPNCRSTKCSGYQMSQTHYHRSTDACQCEGGRLSGPAPPSRHVVRSPVLEKRVVRYLRQRLAKGRR